MPENRSPTSQGPWRGRYLILVANSSLVFGFYFCTDMPSAVQTLLQKDKVTNCSGSNTSCCSECIGLGPVKYNMLYSIYSWTNAVLVFPVGVLIDRIGIRISGLVFSGIGLVGTVIFALSFLETLQGTSYMFYLMAAGRLLLGAGTGAGRITQDRVVAQWFSDKLGFAFGVVVTVLRMGSVLTFFVTASVAQKFGLAVAFWLGAVISSTCFLSAIALSFLDWYGCKQHKENNRISTDHTLSIVDTLREIRYFPFSFWLVSIKLATYYSFLVCFIANGGKFFEDKYGYTRTEASYINGILYDTSLIACPLVGQAMDRLGGRALVSTVGGLVTIPLMVVLLLTDFNVVLKEVLLGLSYSVIVIALWPSIAKLVPLTAVATANGITALMLHTSSGLSNLVIGKILGDNISQSNASNEDNWTAVFVVLLCHLSVMALAGGVLNIVDKAKGCVLNGRGTNTTTTSVMSKDKEILVPGPDSAHYGTINQ